MISTHFDSPHRPTEQELRQLDLVSWQAANYLERKQAEQNEKLLVDELQHRTNNLLTIIQSIAQRSSSGSYPLAQAKEIFDARLQALARTHHKLTKSNVSWLSLEEIVKTELDTFSDRTKIEGASILLDYQQAQRFSLAVHELATNAVKHGALSSRRVTCASHDSHKGRERHRSKIPLEGTAGTNRCYSCTTGFRQYVAQNNVCWDTF